MWSMPFPQYGNQQNPFGAVMSNGTAPFGGAYSTPQNYFGTVMPSGIAPFGQASQNTPIYIISEPQASLFQASCNSFVFLPSAAPQPIAPPFTTSTNAITITPAALIAPQVFAPSRRSQREGSTDVLDRNMPCRHFAEGKCNRRKCRFSHELKQLSLVERCG